MKVLYPDNVAGRPDLPDDVTVVDYHPRSPIPPEHHDAEVLVTWGCAPAMLEAAANELTRLRWVQSLAAGPDGELRAGFAPEVRLTSGRSLHDDTVAEHTLALILAALRGLRQLIPAQAEHRWRADLGEVQVEGAHDRLDTLHRANVLVWGFGSIGQRLAPLLTALGARVTGVAHTAGERSGYPVIADDE